MGAKVIPLIIGIVLSVTLSKVGLAGLLMNSGTYELGTIAVAAPAYEAESAKSDNSNPVRGYTQYRENDAVHTPERELTYTTREAVVTAYSKFETCPSSACVTASGRMAKVGMVACPRDIKFGTKISIDLIIYSCEDRTHLRFDGRFDIFMASYKDAIAFGKQTLTVRIYD